VNPVRSLQVGTRIGHRSISMSLPTTCLARVGAESPAQQITIALAFKEESIGSVRYFKLHSIAANEALKRSNAVAAQMYNHLTMQEAIRLRPQAQFQW
jgi:hypothetical protein